MRPCGIFGTLRSIPELHKSFNQVYPPSTIRTRDCVFLSLADGRVRCRRAVLRRWLENGYDFGERGGYGFIGLLFWFYLPPPPIFAYEHGTLYGTPDYNSLLYPAESEHVVLTIKEGLMPDFQVNGNRQDVRWSVDNVLRPLVDGMKGLRCF
jgi:hypothetical protein